MGGVGSYTTLGEILRGERTVTFVESAGARKRVSYDELRRRALSLLTELRERGVAKGDHLVLFLDDNERFLVAFWAAILGGIVPVPIAVGLSDEHRAKLLRVLALLERAHLYTDERNYARGVVQAFQPALLVEQFTLSAPPAEVHASQPDDVAFIQFSSGSTSDPKGVVLTHRNLLTNIDAIIDWTKFTPADISLSWMPLTHDMGLIGFHLTMMAAGMDQLHMPTSLFVRHPLLWMKTASESGATILASPNFGYRHFLRAFHGGEKLHLDRVRMIVNGAEPISAPLCDEFLGALEPYGLRRSAMFPVYGLAEASLGVTFTPLESGVRTEGGRVRVGFPIKHCEVRVDDEGRVLIRGGNVSRRYYGQPARAEDAWLDTGDLGFFVDGELVISGRAKEVIFIHGQNFYPHDLELVAETHAGAEPGKVVAAGDSELMLFVLHRGSIEEFVPIAAKLRGALSEHAGVEVVQAVPVRRIPKTTSGKVQRHLLLRQFEEGEFDAALADLAKLTRVDAAEPRSEIEGALLALFHSADGELKIGVDDNLFEAGLSSLTLVEVFSRIEEKWPDALEVTEMFDYPTVRQLAERLALSVISD